MILRITLLLLCGLTMYGIFKAYQLDKLISFEMFFTILFWILAAFFAVLAEGIIRAILARIGINGKEKK